MDNLSVNHLIGIKNLNLNDLELIFNTADNFKEIINRPIKKVPSLRDLTIASITSEEFSIPIFIASGLISFDVNTI